MTQKNITPLGAEGFGVANAHGSAATPVYGDVPVLELQKNARERLRISYTSFKGKEYVDLRVWYVDDAGDYQPSQRGVSIRPEQLAEVIQGLSIAARGVGRR